MSQNRFADITIDTAIDYEDKSATKKLSDDIKRLQDIFSADSSSKINDEEAESLIRIGNKIVENLDRTPHAAHSTVKRLAQKCFLHAYQRTAPDSPQRTAAFQALLKCDDQLICHNRDGIEYNGTFATLLGIRLDANEEPDIKNPKNELRPDEVKAASQYVLDTLRKKPAGYTLGMAFFQLMLNPKIVPQDIQDQAADAIIEKAGQLENKPTDAVFEYTCAMRIIAGNYLLAPYAKSRRYNPSHLNPKGRELMGKASATLFTYASRIAESNPDEATEAYKAIITWDYDEGRVNDAINALGHIAPNEVQHIEKILERRRL